MSQNSGIPFPLPNRIIVGISSLGLIALAVYFTVEKAQQNQLNAVNIFLALAFGGLGVGGILLSVAWKNRSRSDIAEELDAESPAHPEIADDCVTYLYSTGLQPAAVYLDIEGNQIHFRNCLVPRRFLASAEEWSSCEITQLLAVYRFRYRGETLTIVTEHGKAVIPSGGEGYAELRDALMSTAPENDPRGSRDHPLVSTVYLGGILAGGVCGVLTTPQRAGGDTLGLFVLLGAIVGAVATFGVVQYAAQRKIDVVRPAGFGVFGCLIGIFLASTVLNPVFQQNGTAVAVFLAFTALVGVIAGVVTQPQRNSPNN